MDAATRAELEALRRRAYGPEADIHDDPVALARLQELEERPPGSADRPEPAEPEPLPAETASLAAESTPAGTAAISEPSTAASRAPASGRPSLVRSAVFGAAAVVVAVVVGSAVWTSVDPSTAPSPTVSPTSGTQVSAAPTIEQPGLTGIGILTGVDPDAEELLRITLDGSFGNFIDLPLDGDAPVFPTSQRLEWAAPLGVYYGWDLWIAGGTGADEDDYCLLIRREDDVRAHCAGVVLRRFGALQVSVAAADIDPQRRPAQMTDSQRIAFWWLDGGEVEIVLGTFDPGAIGSTTIEIHEVDGEIVRVEPRTGGGG